MRLKRWIRKDLRTKWCEAKALGNTARRNLNAAMWEGHRRPSKPPSEAYSRLMDGQALGFPEHCMCIAPQIASNLGTM
eukprot:1158678-Pelagomonas_calceolata.AAC.5